MDFSESDTRSFSVVIPVYNRENTVRRAIESVLRQTYEDLEVIVVDDGSTDGTKDVVTAIEDDRLHYFYQENQGAQVARNRGIMEATGDWIAFLDSDDEWVPNKLEKQIAVLRQENFNPFVVVHTDCIVKDLVNHKEYVWHLPNIKGDNVYARLLAGGGPMFQGMLTSKNALQKIGLLDKDVVAFQEWDTAIALAKYCKFIFVDEPMFIYYLHEGDTISKDRVKDVEGYYYIISKRKEDILRLCGIQKWNQLLYSLCMRCVDFGFRERAERFFFMRFGKPMELEKFMTDLKKCVHSASGVYCYGAGKIGSRVKRFLDSMEMPLNGYVVSEGEPLGMHEGITVRSVSNLRENASCLMIISTREQLHKEISLTLKKYGFTNIYPLTDERHLCMLAWMRFIGAGYSS